MKKLFTTLFFGALLTISASLTAQVSVWDGTWEPWTNGTGTEEDPFLIENAQQLAYLFYYVNSGFYANGGHVTNHDYHYKLMVDVNLNGNEGYYWTPIGYWNSDDDYQCFGGCFDGNNHTISNLYIDSSSDRVGLFGYIDGVTIEKLNINSGTIHTTGRYAGGIIGFSNGICTVKKCYNNTAVFSSDNSGGIIGWSDGSVNIVNCQNSGSISSYSGSGGIIGLIHNNTNNVVNCINNGGITISHNGNWHYGGGIIGVKWYGTVFVTNCYNTANIALTGSGSARYAAGIVGANNAGYTYIANSYNIGSISNSSGYKEGIGGNQSGSINIVNSYYLNTCGGNNTWGGEPKTNDYMQSEEFVDILNNDICYWEYDWDYSNSGYPVLTGLCVATSNATNVMQTNATLHGTIEAGNTTIYSQGFEYKKTTDSYYQMISVSGTGNIVILLENLLPDTQYQYRTFCATTDCGIIYGEDKTFTTLSLSVTTNDATNVTQTHATLNGNLNIGNANVSSKGFEYKRTTDSNYQTVTISGSGDVSATLSGLTPNTQYLFRIFCIPVGGSAMYGQEKTFNTLDISVTTNNATNVTQTHAKLNGTLNIGDANISSKGFEYRKATDSIYQTVTISGSGNVYKTLSGLIPDTQYRFRIFCIPEDGSAIYGEEKSFWTQELIQIEDSNVTETHATLTGVVWGDEITIVEQGFEYKQTSESNYHVINIPDINDFSYVLDDLYPYTHYDCRAFCRADNNETYYSRNNSIWTKRIVINTLYISPIDETTVEFYGELNSGDATITGRGFEYKHSWGPGPEKKDEDDRDWIRIPISNAGDFSANVYGLAKGEYYEYRAYANINDRYYYGDEKDFQVPWFYQNTMYIYDIEQLLWFANKVNYVDGYDFQGVIVKLMADIELPQYGISIGRYPNRPFKGVFDGNGKRLYNLSLDEPNSHYVGVFGYTQDAYILNLRIDNPTINGRNYCGGLVGYAENTEIENCCVTGGVLHTLNYSGGLVGYYDGGTSVISGCYSTCDVNGSNYVGGFIGSCNGGTIRNNYVAGGVFGMGNAVGGIIGEANEVLMYYSYFNTEITGQNTAIGENNLKDGEGVTTAQMRNPQFVATINQGLTNPVFEADLIPYINNGFPILMWQDVELGPCFTPMGLTYSLVNGPAIMLSWNTNNTADYFVIEYGIEGEEVNTAYSLNNYYAFQYEPYKIYYWRVKSVCSSGESNFVDGTNINTGVQENTSESNHVLLYPNPAHDIVTIKLNASDINLKQIDVFDISGRKVLSEITSGESHNLNVSNLPKGIYFVRVVTSDNNIGNVKLVVQ